MKLRASVILATLVLTATACSNGDQGTTPTEAPLPPLATASPTGGPNTGLPVEIPTLQKDVGPDQGQAGLEAVGHSPTPTPVVRLNLNQSTLRGEEPSSETNIKATTTPQGSDPPNDQQPPQGQASPPPTDNQGALTPLQHPDKPQFTDEILLQDIYQGINLERYALNDQDPALKERPERYPSVPFEEYRDHPYLHMFPSVQTQIKQITRQAEQQGESPPQEFTHLLYQEALNDDDRSQFRGRYGIEHFLAHPYWEPILESHIQNGETLEVKDWLRTPYGDFNARHFGKTSTRQVIADAVTTMLESAMLPEIKPYKFTWLEEPNRHTNPPPLREYVKTAIAPNHSSPSHDAMGIPFPAYMPPKANWDFLDPNLPIIQVAATTETTLPLTPANADTERWPVAPRLEQSIPPLSKYTVHFVVAFQNRWTSFSDHNRWVLRFTESMIPEETGAWWEGTTECRADHCRWNTGHGALDQELASKFPQYWHSSDYMQHSIIGDIILVVHESPVLKEGVYAIRPAISQWDAPGLIVKTEQLNAPWFPELSSQREFPILQRWPYPGRPNPGYPLPGHVYADSASAPGSRIWEEWGLSPDWD